MECVARQRAVERVVPCRPACPAYKVFGGLVRTRFAAVVREDSQARAPAVCPEGNGQQVTWRGAWPVGGQEASPARGACSVRFWPPGQEGRVVQRSLSCQSRTSSTGSSPTCTFAAVAEAMTAGTYR